MFSANDAMSEGNVFLRRSRYKICVDCLMFGIVPSYFHCSMFFNELNGENDANEKKIRVLVGRHLYLFFSTKSQTKHHSH